MENTSVISVISGCFSPIWVDTQHGWTRWHTRVTAPSARNADGSWNRDYFRERAFNALPMAHVLYGGKLGSFKLKPRPYRAGRRGRR